MPADPPCPYVSRGGLKLAAALDAFGLSVQTLTCADLGANVGGFTDCLLQRGAAHVHALDTAYGQFAWKLRQDPRVTVLERTNALHYTPPADFAGADLVVIDLGWTPQRLALPAAQRWLKPNSLSHIITLIKPHYELAARQPQRGHKQDILDASTAQSVLQDTLAEIPSLNLTVLNTLQSPLRGGGSRGKQANIEFLALLRPL